MIKYFCTYEQSLALKELGFDEECFGLFFKQKKQFIFNPDTRAFDNELFILAPLKSQAFEFFRERFGYHHSIDFDSWSSEKYSFSLNRKKDKSFHYDDTTQYDTYEEAEDACLNKLLELCKK